MEGIIPFIDSLSLEETNDYFYCKLLENMMPTYILPIFEVDSGKNATILESMMKEFFKMLVIDGVDLDMIKMSKIYQNNLMSMFNMRNLYFFEPKFFEAKLELYLPEDGYLATEESLNEATEKFVDLLVYKFMT